MGSQNLHLMKWIKISLTVKQQIFISYDVTDTVLGSGTMEVKQNKVPALISQQPSIQPAANKHRKRNSLMEQTIYPEKKILIWGTVRLETLSPPPRSSTQHRGRDLPLKGDWKVSSVQFSHSVVSDSLQPHEPQHTRPPCPSPTPRVYSNPCPLSQWCHQTISSSIVPSSLAFNLS